MPENETPDVEETPNVTELATQDESDHRLRNAEVAVRLMKEALPTLLTLCQTADIIDYGGKPYFRDSGCQKIARVLNVGYGKPEMLKAWEHDPESKKEVYSVIVEGMVTCFGQTIPATGGCTSEDKFLASRHLSRAEVILEVQRKALANWRGAGIRALLGLNGVSWEDLKRLGFDNAKATRVDFQKGKYSGKPETDNTSVPTSASGKPDNVKVEIANQIFKDCKENPETAKEMLRRITTFEDHGKVVNGVESVESPRFTPKWAYRILSAIRPGGSGRKQYETELAALLGEADNGFGA